jgi:hypothetical protein
MSSTTAAGSLLPCKRSDDDQAFSASNPGLHCRASAYSAPWRSPTTAWPQGATARKLLPPVALQAQLVDAGIEPQDMAGTVNGTKPGRQPEPQDIPLKAD